MYIDFFCIVLGVFAMCRRGYVKYLHTFDAFGEFFTRTYLLCLSSLWDWGGIYLNGICLRYKNICLSTIPCITSICRWMMFTRGRCVRGDKHKKKMPINKQNEKSSEERKRSISNLEFDGRKDLRLWWVCLSVCVCFVYKCAHTFVKMSHKMVKRTND